MIDVFRMYLKHGFRLHFYAHTAIISCRAKMARKEHRKALFRVFWNNVNQKMIDDPFFSFF